MSELIGYARVSTQEQELNLQLDELQNEKGRIFVDKNSGAKAQRPGLDQCLAKLKKGDTLLVWRLDWLGRSMNHLVLLIEDLRSIWYKKIAISY